MRGINIDSLYKLIKEEDISTLILVHVLGHNSSIEKVSLGGYILEDCDGTPDLIR